MKDIRRLVIALVLSLVVLIVSNRIMKRYAPKKVVTTGAPVEEKAVTPEVELSKKDEVVWPARSAAQPKERREMSRRARKGGEEDVVIETKLYKVVFSPGGVIKHWQLIEKDENGELKYKKNLPREEEPTEPVDLVSGSDTPTQHIYEVTPLKGQLGVRLRTKGGGLEILKEITFEEDRYRAVLRYKIINNSPFSSGVPLFGWGPGIAGTTQPVEILFTSYKGSKAKRHKAHKVKDTINQGDVLWSGIGGKYFALAMLPGAGEQSMVIKKGSSGARLEAVVEHVAPGSVASGKMDIYAGPKDYEALKSEEKELHELINFGFFGVIGKVIFQLLKWLYRLTGNYGIAIIIISVLIKVILFPLSQKSVKSMQGMQKVQPQIEMLKQRFKGDKEALGKETMELYKRMKINPMGGCLPMALQLPVFFALYVVFRNAIELRQAPFISFWIKDLSAPDPSRILPILMGITMFLQQRMSPTSSQQGRAMMYFMPIFLTVIFMNFPAGLVIYWVTNSVLSIVEQKLIKRMA